MKPGTLRSMQARAAEEEKYSRLFPRVPRLLKPDPRALQLGIATIELRAAMATAAIVWHARRPWRWLPASLRWALFPWLGRRFVGRFVDRWVHSGRNMKGGVHA